MASSPLDGEHGQRDRAATQMSRRSPSRESVLTLASLGICSSVATGSPPKRRCFVLPASRPDRQWPPAHEGKAADQQDSHHDDGNFQHPHLTRGEHRAWQWRIVGLARDRHPRRPHASIEEDTSPQAACRGSRCRAHEGQRLDRFLAERLPELSRTRVQSLIKEGQVSLGGATIVEAKYRVKPGDRFELGLPPADAARARRRGHSPRHRLRGRRAHRHRQARRASWCIPAPATPPARWSTR